MTEISVLGMGKGKHEVRLMEKHLHFKQKANAKKLSTRHSKVSI